MIKVSVSLSFFCPDIHLGSMASLLSLASCAQQSFCLLASPLSGCLASASEVQLWTVPAINRAANIRLQLMWGVNTHSLCPACRLSKDLTEFISWTNYAGGQFLKNKLAVYHAGVDYKWAKEGGKQWHQESNSEFWLLNSSVNSIYTCM